VNTSEDPVTLDFFFPLQSRAANEPLFPNLRAFECRHAIPASVPLLPSFLSHRTTDIHIGFDTDSPTVMVASMVARLPMLCPDLEYITLKYLRRDPVITEAVSDMALACNRGVLQWFCVDSPLTEEAREVVFQLPNLINLWAVIRGPTLLPSVALPNLVSIDLEYDDRLDWLQGFRGGMLERLETVYFTSISQQIGDFLQEFKSVALTTSIPATLSEFRFQTLQSWNPSYHSLLPFTQLKTLLIEFSCDNHCSSTLDGNILIDLVRAMPKLEILELGGAPCRTRGGATIKGLIALARGCRHLSKLRIHFQTASLVEVAIGVEVPAISNGETVVRWQDCALTDLEVGEIPIPEDTVDMVTMTLLQIFPRLLNINFVERKWESAMKTIRAAKRISTFVQHTSKGHLLHPYYQAP